MDMNLIEEMIQTRRQIHQRPEEGWTEFETTHLVANRLKSIGYKNILLGKELIDEKSVLGRDEQLIEKEIQRAVDNGVPQRFIEEIGGYTGCAAVLETGRQGPITAFRFDMDCVLVEETNDQTHLPNQYGFRSQRSGLMHACGHDGHTAVGLALARWIFENQERLKGTIKLIFQPAEEGVRGAVAIANSGLLDDVDYILASHCGGVLLPKEIGLIYSGLLASTKFDIHFTGTPSHAGNQPHKGHSALMAACATAMMMVGIPRHGDGASRVSVGRLNAGEGRNVTPVHADIQAEVRGETAEINSYMCRAVENIVNGNALAYEVSARLEKVGEATTLVCCPDVLNIVREVAEAVPNVQKVEDLNRPSGSEDFSIMLKRVTNHGGKGAIFKWGCRHNGHHKSDFDIQDTETMPVALEVFIGFTQKINGQ